MATKKLFFLFSILLSVIGTKAWAYDIAVENADGVTIYYNYINDGKELAVTYDPDAFVVYDGIDDYYKINNSYKGVVVIPGEVTYMNKTMKVTSISDYVFESCSDLTSVSIPASVKSIGVKCLYNCKKLKDLYCDAENPPFTEWLDEDYFDDGLLNNGTLHVPSKAIDNYKSTWVWKEFVNIVAIKEETDVDMIKITSAGQTTWCSAYDLDFTDVEGLKAYTATGYHRTKGTIWLTRVKEVPAGEGILLIGDAGDYKVPHVATTAYYANLMVGTVEAITINETEGEYTNYYLSNGASGVGFYKVNGSVDIKANRAYLPLLKNTVSSTRGFIGIDFGEDSEGTTNIQSSIFNVQSDGVYYNLQGQRVDNPSKGLYIKNGKKVLIK